MFEEKIKTELERGSSASIINLVDTIVWHAEDENASDIHLDPTELTLNIKFRVDGILLLKYSFNKHLHPEIISRIKILSRLRTDEHQAPQDGRFTLRQADGPALDVRVSVIPTYHGENAVLRLLRDSTQGLSLKDLGLSELDAKKIIKTLKHSSGMILVTGPTGSGKTTTLYTLIKLLQREHRSIITIEDPIEYAVTGIRQIQINPQRGLTFASGLRSIVRQDPDIVMVGEIRDNETARISINIALTGHLLLSTMHTNNAATTLPRLIDMGIDSYLIASTISIVIGQRLVRKICPHCKQETQPQDDDKQTLIELYPELQDISFPFFKGLGCSKCNHTGFKGRIGIYEIMVMNAEIQKAVLDRMPASSIEKTAVAQGMQTLLKDGIEKVKHGITTLEEVLATIHV